MVGLVGSHNTLARLTAYFICQIHFQRPTSSLPMKILINTGALLEAGYINMLCPPLKNVFIVAINSWSK